MVLKAIVQKESFKQFKKYFFTTIFLWILRNFHEQLFL